MIFLEQRLDTGTVYVTKKLFFADLLFALVYTMFMVGKKNQPIDLWKIT